MSEGHGEPPADAPLYEPARPDEQTLARSEQVPQPLAQTELAQMRQPHSGVVASDDDPGWVSAKPQLTTGDYGAPVAELAHLLADNGYPNAVADGTAPPMLTDDLMRLVREFQAANDVDPAASQDGAAPIVRRDHGGIVTAETWAALHGVTDKGDAAEKGLAVTVRYPAGSFA